jgi:hypothetical protein
MAITLLRWKSGAAGDTILKCILDSNPNLHSQNCYVELNDARTIIDQAFVYNFPYSEIAKMSLTDIDCDVNLLEDQLHELNNSDKSKNWILKTHLYHNFNFLNIIDIVIGLDTLPFTVQASLEKNSREKNLLPKYHVLIDKIKNPEILYKFDCFNFIKDRVMSVELSNQQINLADFLKGWNHFQNSIEKVDLFISDNCKKYYDNWIAQNKKFFPSKLYLSMIGSKDYDYTNVKLSIVEKYCMLVLSGENFKIL